MLLHVTYMTMFPGLLCTVNGVMINPGKVYMYVIRCSVRA